MAKETKGKRMTSDELSGDLRQLSEQESPHEMYMPQDEELKKAWDPYKPRNFYDRLWRGASPSTYFLWKMPPETHKKFNDILGYALAMFGKEPRAAAVLGITDGISQTIYGLKTMKQPNGQKSKSGKHVMSGLTKIVDQAENSSDPQLKKFSSKIKKFFERYMVNFDPKQAAAMA